ncbi:GNAT family N-acetyltransferase [Candidatus Rhabdochlamydia sp. T3358]|uniref:GNAT family N-acetyltransferase n=1 Tax=Candidatus Rhabdochlamydia sp. T3358 TaxID=2099795 RepID=UPI0010B0FB60|nr:GNAT family N-acetyltransferase [Candidatus Rhabdochlamydia sp. T3358]VHO03277.1 hypothetical protein RHT_00842 [Candidatus Rhabdochlamydia sp. T3358]
MIELEESLYQINEMILRKAFALNGTSPFQSPKALQARLMSLPHQDFACFLFHSHEQLIFSSFERMDDQLWRCFFLGDAFLINGSVDDLLLKECLQIILRRLGATSLYFPYIDQRTRSFSFFSQLENGLCLQRLPSPYILWEKNSQLFIDRIQKNSKRRAQRFWNKFENRLQLQELSGKKAIRALDEIEQKSWKHASQQSMHFREKQFAFYSDWLRREGLFLHVAEENGNPVAYRLDAKLHHTVYALKYSYDDQYKQFSPGYYLLTQGLYSRWKNAPIKNIDLWGSPDTLKNSIKTGEYQRHDFLWPASPMGQKLLDERLTHDKNLSNHLNNNVGLKTIYKIHD